MKVKLPNGNVASRVLPIIIYELDRQDIRHCESVLGSILRGIELIYNEPGVNRPLKPDDDEKINLNKTKYRNQINKVGNAIKEIVSGLSSEPDIPGKGKIRYVEPREETRKEDRKGIRAKPVKSIKWKLLSTVVIAAIIIIGGILVYPGFIKKTNTPDVEKSLVLMNFKNLTGDTANNYLAEMHHAALYQELCKISEVRPLRIVGPKTTAVFEKNRETVTEVASDVSVDYLVEGSLLSTGDVEEVFIRLMEVSPKEKHVWADNYSSDRKNILKLYRNIAGVIVKKIGFDLLPQDQVKLSQPGQVNPQSYEAYTRGMVELNRSTPEGLKKGMEYLHEAVNIAPEDPLANAGLALGYLAIAHDGGGGFIEDALEKGEEYAYKALMLDSTIAQVHAALAEAYLYGSWKFTESEKHFKKALELNPNQDMAHYHYAWALDLWGRLDEAIAEHKLAQKYDPYNPLHTAWLGWLYVYDGRYDDAIECALESFKIQKDYPVGYRILGFAYMKKGMTEEAIDAHKKLAELYGDIVPLGFTYACTNHRAGAEIILHEIESQPINSGNAFSRARLNAVLGNKDEAFKWLAYEPHSAVSAWAAVLEQFDSLHGDPRWQEFLNRLNLPKK